MGVPWEFPADLSIIAWLEHQKYDYDVLTDEDLQRKGVAPNTGAVFSAGSIAFGQALAVHNFNNNVSRILANVVNAFLRDGVLPGERWISEEKQWK